MKELIGRILGPVFSPIWNALTHAHAFAWCVIFLFSTGYCVTYIEVPKQDGRVLAEIGWNLLTDVQKANKRDIAVLEANARAAGNGSLIETRESVGLLMLQLKWNNIESQKRSIENSSYYDSDQKNRMLQDLNIKVRDLDNDMNRKGYKLEEIQSRNNGRQYAGYIPKAKP